MSPACANWRLEEVKEQDWSLNPGRYVGVVIEEDGKTEEEFMEEIETVKGEIEALHKTASKLHSVIVGNLDSMLE
jgi:type I restriction enzyme M protein